MAVGVETAAQGFLADFPTYLAGKSRVAYPGSYVNIGLSLLDPRGHPQLHGIVRT
jgi:hypothetical protein